MLAFFLVCFLLFLSTSVVLPFLIQLNHTKKLRKTPTVYNFILLSSNGCFVQNRNNEGKSIAGRAELFKSNYVALLSFYEISAYGGAMESAGLIFPAIFGD